MQIINHADEHRIGLDGYQLGLHVETMRTVKEIEGIREVWAELQGESPEDIDVFVTVVSSRPEVVGPYVMLFSSSGTPQAIMAGRLEESKLSFRLGYKSVWSQKARVLAIADGGFMGDVSLTSSVSLVRELLLLLKRNEADVIFFQSVALESPLLDAIKATVPFFLRGCTARPQPRWTMKLPASTKTFHENMSRNERHEVRKIFKYLERDYPGQVRSVIFERPSDVDTLCKAAEYVTKKTYLRALGVGYVDNEENRDRLRLYAAKGRLFAEVLYIGEEACAFWIGFFHGRTLYLYFTGYDPQYSKYRLGTALYTKIVEDLINRNTEVVDFGFGDARYKHRFGGECRYEIPFYIYRPSPKWVWTNFVLTVSTTSRSLILSALNRLNLVQRIKTGWRKRILSKHHGEV